MAPLVILGPLLARVGAPILKSILVEEVGGRTGQVGSVVIDALSAALGVDPTPEAIDAAHKADPVTTETAIKDLENDPAMVTALAEALKSRDALLAVESTKGFFYDGWRPALSWMLAFLCMWTWVLVPLVNAVFHAQIAGMAPNELVWFGGTWLTIYGGGHTVKDIAGKMFGGGK